MTPPEQMLAICREVTVHLERQRTCWGQDLLPKLRETGIYVLSYGDLEQAERNGLRQYFLSEIFPTLTPLAIDPTHPFPHISNLSFNLAVVVKDPERVTASRALSFPIPFGVWLRCPLKKNPPRRRKISEESGKFSGLLGWKKSWRIIWISCFPAWRL